MTRKAKAWPHDTPTCGHTTAQSQNTLFMRYRSRDRRTRDELAAHFSPLALRLARRYHYTSEPYEDLCQVAQLALVNAVDRFDPDRGYSFTSYAVPSILGELRRYFRDCSWAVHVPRGSQERALRVRDAEQALTEKHGRSPSVAELAVFTDLSGEQVIDALRARRAQQSISLDAPMGDAQDSEDSSYADALGDEDERFEYIEKRTDVQKALRKLNEHQREIMRLRYYNDMTQSQIGETLGVSQMQVSRLLARSLDELRQHTEAVPA